MHFWLGSGDTQWIVPRPCWGSPRRCLHCYHCSIRIFVACLHAPQQAGGRVSWQVPVRELMHVEAMHGLQQGCFGTGCLWWMCPLSGWHYMPRSGASGKATWWVGPWLYCLAPSVCLLHSHESLHVCAVDLLDGKRSNLRLVDAFRARRRLQSNKHSHQAIWVLDITNGASSGSEQQVSIPDDIRVHNRSVWAGEK